MYVYYIEYKCLFIINSVIRSAIMIFQSRYLKLCNANAIISSYKTSSSRRKLTFDFDTVKRRHNPSSFAPENSFVLSSSRQATHVQSQSDNV